MITSTATTITADNCMVLIQCNCDLVNDSVPKGRSSGCEDDLEGPFLVSYFYNSILKWIRLIHQINFPPSPAPPPQPLPTPPPLRTPRPLRPPQPLRTPQPITLRFAVIFDRLAMASGSVRYLRALLDVLLVLGEVLLVYGQASHLPSGLNETMRLSALSRRRPDVEAARERLNRVIGRFRPDIVIVQNVMSTGLLDALSAAPRGVCVVQDHRCFCPGPGKVLPDGAECREPFGEVCDICFLKEGRLDRDTRDERLSLVRGRLAALKRFSRLVVLSSYMARRLVESGIAAGKISVIPPSLPAFVRDAKPAGDGSAIAVCGRICRHKGQRLFARVLAEAGCRRSIRFVGGGPGERKLQYFLARAPLDAKITGWLCDSELLAELRRAAYAALPSIWAEPFGMAGMEASALGLPVLAIEGGGVTEWLNPGKTGLMVPRNSAESLLAAGRHLEDPALRSRLGAAGRRLVRRRFTQAGFSRSWMELLESLARTYS